MPGVGNLFGAPRDNTMEHRGRPDFPALLDYISSMLQRGDDGHKARLSFRASHEPCMLLQATSRAYAYAVA